MTFEAATLRDVEASADPQLLVRALIFRAVTDRGGRGLAT